MSATRSSATRSSATRSSATWSPVVVQVPDGPTTVQVASASTARAVLLLHGWGATADRNWSMAAAPLVAAGWTVVAPDHRAHGRGSRAPFSIDGCADDAAAVMEALGFRRFAVAGYSMGGAVAQALWHRHPLMVDALVLCATAATFAPALHARRSRVGLAAATVAARALPSRLRAALGRRIGSRLCGADDGHDWLGLLDAGRDLLRFDARPWLGRVDVPVAVVATTEDRVVPAWRQEELAGLIHARHVERITGDHAFCLERPEEFADHFVAALDAVAGRPHAALAATVRPGQLRSTDSITRAA